MPKRLAFVNLLLSGIALLLAGVLVWIIRTPEVEERPEVSRTFQEVKKAPPIKRVERQEVDAYQVIVTRELFAKPPVQALARPRAQSPAPSAPSLPQLLGTIIEEGRRRAILRDGAGKPDFYTLGEEIAGGVIVDIQEDRVLFKRGETVSEILMPKALQSAASSQPSAVSSDQGPPSALSTQERQTPLPQGSSARLPPPPIPQAGLGQPAEGLGFTVVPILAGGRIAKVVVNMVRPFSPARAAGLQKGDVIAQINGREVAAMAVEEVNAFLQSGPVALTVERAGRRLEIQVEAP